MLDKEGLLERISTLLDDQNFAVLATRGDEHPYTTLVGFARSEDCRQIIFATSRHTRKYRNLKKAPNVSLLFDNRTNHVRDLKDAEALTALGTAREVDGTDEERGLTLYLNRHPYLEEFVSGPDSVLISVEVSRYILVSNFQNVLEYKVL